MEGGYFAGISCGVLCTIHHPMDTEDRARYQEGGLGRGQAFRPRDRISSVRWIKLPLSVAAQDLLRYLDCGGGLTEPEDRASSLTEDFPMLGKWLGGFGCWARS